MVTPKADPFAPILAACLTEALNLWEQARKGESSTLTPMEAAILAGARGHAEGLVPK